VNRLIILFSTLFLLCACGNKLSPEEQALHTAQETALSSYQNLLAGRYEAFLSSRIGMDSIPDSYRQQLKVSYKQFMTQQQKAHGGINSINVSRAEFMSESNGEAIPNNVQVFLVINYADSVQEEIVVPMVQHNGRWMIK